MQNQYLKLLEVIIISCLLVITLLCSRLAWLTYNDSREVKRGAGRIDFLIVGAHECGAEALSKSLKTHPKLKNKVGAAHFFDKNYNHEETDRYFSQLAHAKDDELSFECTSSYFSSSDAPERIAKAP